MGTDQTACLLVEAFMTERASQEIPLGLLPLSTGADQSGTEWCYAHSYEACTILVEFLWEADLKNTVLADRDINPLEIKIIEPLIELLEVEGYELSEVIVHCYDSGVGQFVFTLCA